MAVTAATLVVAALIVWHRARSGLVRALDPDHAVRRSRSLSWSPGNPGELFQIGTALWRNPP
ncbi:MAG TPA: hypothetical protein DEA69_02550 [Microbacterium sp.]|nr:hypothetical protein [Microbacterium sp.]OJV94249.1 MAG: hypothetical protein BGO47_10990 [Microbacterium sp. 67-17]HAS32913.1 hypothetical protein [Microbacterium sp.]HBS07674.1 hypothetical protein [Microbacterium sp.]